MISAQKKKGHYLGTEISGKWWRRYSREGFLARGMGEYWFEDSALLFHRFLTKKPITIPFSEILDIKTGKWHSGRWAGGATVVKIVWQKADKHLCSGFVFSKDAGETKLIIDKLKSLCG